MNRVVLSLFLLAFMPGVFARAQDVKAKIAALEAKWKANPDRFDGGLHNELRHLYSGFDERKSMLHVDIILKHSPMDGYMLSILAHHMLEKNPREALDHLTKSAVRFKELPFLRAACLLKAGDLERGLKNADKANSLFKQVAALPGKELEPYRNAAIARLDEVSFAGKDSKAPWTIPVLVLNYFPVTKDGKNIDIKVTSNVGGTLADMRKKVERQTQQTINALEQGSRFRAYSNPRAEPSLKYEIVETMEYLEPVPHHKKKKGFADYSAILERAKIKHYVMEKGVKEVWIWGYHSKEIGPVESNMASVHGDISNSHRDPLDLPVFPKTYTVYHYNYEREASMAVHNHLHQIEALMRHHGGELWNTFEGKPGAWRAGNCHFPVNGRKDYDYANKEFVESDIEDWRPEGFGRKKKINCDLWNCDDMKWYVYWMQSIPGKDNGLTFKGRPLTNWWIFTGDYDYAVARKMKTVQD